ncbi:hypothetical protein GCM10025862_27440 [Arsenicicoccus piscis]|uniref:EamA domain-containing protein n=2 Tax=Arsenicicoccus piscis TaxID=673954 RepID=A0ABQ6HSR0_9MICO|nr:hypothetical protein GCM10025862_27440 [Arsenicicoccus piscis]
MEVIPPLLFAALRFTLVALPAVFFVRPPGNGWKTVVGCGATMAMGQFGLLYTAMNLGMPAGLASLVLQIQTVFTVTIAAWLLRERPTSSQLLGIAIGVLGMAVVGGQFVADAPALPFVLTIAAAMSWATGNVLTRRRPPRDGFSLVVWSAIVAPVPLLVGSLLLEGWGADVHALTHLTWPSLGGLAFVTYGASMAGYGIWNLLLSRHSAAVVAPWSMFVPPIGTVAAFFYNGETPTLLGIVGGVITIAGVLLALGVGGRRRADVPDRAHPPAEPAGRARRPVARAGRGARRRLPRKHGRVGLLGLGVLRTRLGEQVVDGVEALAHLGLGGAPLLHHRLEAGRGRPLPGVLETGEPGHQGGHLGLDVAGDAGDVTGGGDDAVGVDAELGTHGELLAGGRVRCSGPLINGFASVCVHSL